MIKLAFTGDILSYQKQNCLLKKRLGCYDYTTVFENVSGVLSEADYVIGSLETVVSDNHKYTSSPIIFNTPSQILQALKESGFNLLTTANNHCLDRGISGLEDTIDNIVKYGLDSTGTKSNANTPSYFLFKIGETRIAILSYTYDTNPDANGVILSEQDLYKVNLTKRQMQISNNSNVKSFLYKIKKKVKKIIGTTDVMYYASSVIDCVNDAEISNPLNDIYIQKLKSNIKTAKNCADYVFFCLHSGGQFNDTIGNYTRYLIEEITSCKVDAIICNHTHSILPVSHFSETLVAYSLGNFCFTPFEGYYIDGVYADYSTILFLNIDEKKGVISPTVSFVKNVVGDDGISRVFPLYDLIDGAEDNEQRESLISDLKAVLNRIGIKLEDGEELVQKEYTFNNL